MSRYRDDSLVEDSANITISSLDESHSLTVKEVTVLDFAKYKIEDVNLAGETSASAVLSEKGMLQRVSDPFFLASKTANKVDLFLVSLLSSWNRRCAIYDRQNVTNQSCSSP